MNLAHHPLDTRLAGMLRGGRRLRGIFNFANATTALFTQALRRATSGGNPAISY